MVFKQLERDIIDIISSATGKVSLSLFTEEGEISINSQEVTSAASVIKLPIVMAGLKSAEEGEIDLKENITITRKVGGTGVLKYLNDIHQMTVFDLMVLSIIVSDNTSSNLLIDLIGIDRINRFMESISMKNSQINRRFMDHGLLERGVDNVTTSEDMVICLRCLDDQNSVLLPEHKQLLLNILGDQQFKEKLPSFQNIFAEKMYIGNKTGTLNGVEHDVAIFDNQQKKVFVAILSTDWTYNRDGQQLIAEIGRKVLQYMS